MKNCYVIITATLEVPVPEFDDEDPEECDKADDYAQAAVTHSLSINDIEWELNDSWFPKVEDNDGR